MALAINIRTNKIVDVPNHYIGHEVLGKDLVLATEEAQAAPNKETKYKKEQPAPVAEAVEPEPEINIKENEE